MSEFCWLIEAPGQNYLSAHSRMFAWTKDVNRAIRLLLSTPEISDCDPRDKDEETHVAERAARAALARIEQLTKE